jgi:transcriptional regulator with XRE-family HTH domain
MNLEDDAKRLPIEEHCAAKLKALRRGRGLTLEECEIASAGKFKAVVLGSYERGTRAISLSKLSQLADFYDLPIQYFFTTKMQSQEGRWVFDLRRLREKNEASFPFNFLSSSLARIAELRSDWEGEFLSIRGSDRETFEIVFGKERDQIVSELRSMKIILNEASGPQHP